MTTPHKNFDTGATEEGPSCTFTLGGRKWSCRQPSEVPFAVIKKLTAAKEGTEGTIMRVDAFFQSTLAEDEVEDFMKMLDEPEKSKVTLGNLQPIMEYVTSHVLSRPTKPRPASRKPRRNTKASSAAA